MRKWICFLLVTLCVAAMAAPNIAIYRYIGKNDAKYKNLPESKISDKQMNEAWVRDDGKWTGDKILFMGHGFPMFNEGKNRKGMIALASHYSHPRQIGDKVLPAYDTIYAAEYPAGYDISETAAAISPIVKERCSNLPKDQKIDVFAHSMGGLVLRAAIQFAKISIASRVNHFVTMGTPHNGFGIAEIQVVKNVLGELPPEIECMNTDTPSFIFILNSAQANPKVACNFYSIVGMRSYRPKQYLLEKAGVWAVVFKNLQDEQFSVHDGLIDAASAGYDLSRFCKSYKKKELDLNHDYIKAHQEVFDVIDNWMIADKWFGDIKTGALEKPPAKNPLGDLLASIEKIKVPEIKLPDILNPGPGTAKAETEQKNNDSNLPPPSKEKEPVYTGGVPIMFGQKFNEVGQTMGFLPTWTIKEYDKFFWHYQNWPIEPYSFKVSFNGYGSDGKDPDKKVYWASCFKSIPYDSGGFLKPSQVVPKEILGIEPSEYAYYKESTWASHTILLVIWYRFNRTFVLVVNDSKRPMFDKVKGINDQGQINYTYKLNVNSRNFSQADKVIGFVYVDRYIDFYDRSKGALERISNGDQVYGYLQSIDRKMTGSMEFVKF